MDRADADKFCRDNGMHLVSIENEAKSNFITNLAGENRDVIRNQFWTSGFNLHLNPTEWVWNYSGLKSSKPINFTNWCANEPNNFDKDEHFIGVIGGCWHDVPVGINWPSICEFQANIFDPVLDDQHFFFTYPGERQLVVPCRPSSVFYTGSRIDVSKQVNNKNDHVQVKI